MIKNSGDHRGGAILGRISNAASLPPKPCPSGKHRRMKHGSENVPPVDPNAQIELLSSTSPALCKVPLKIRGPLPPRPPANPRNPLKRKLNLESPTENGAVLSSDSGVKVAVRTRPLNKDEEGEDQIVQKISSNSLTVLDQMFTFDSVAGTESTQEDMFQLVGVPLVENCLAGFNSSIFAYGQSGSGKTYTMWGPAGALTGDNSSKSCLGITPRVFERLFARIQEEQVKHSKTQLSYQCCCSFLEIYNEQITDLLEPSQKNLQIREDVESGVYVENITEEYVNSLKDVTHLLVKGLANRRVGTTSVNVESSRSHSVFTCVVESRFKSVADGSSNLRTSRINLVDLAGSERQKVTGAVGERLREAGNINRALSQLGNLINILAEVSHSGKRRHIPYRDSRLTFLLQDSLGGNAKLAMICAISPARSCKNETLSTLRFAQRAKAIQNKAVVNEISEDDVNVLRDQIRQLKDELIRMKENGNSNGGGNGGYSTGWNARKSLNILRMSVSRPPLLPSTLEDDNDEEMEIIEEGTERLDPVLETAACEQNVNNLQSSSHVSSQPDTRREKNNNGTCCTTEHDLEETDVDMEDCRPHETKDSIIGSTFLSSSELMPKGSTGETDREGVRINAGADLGGTTIFSTVAETADSLILAPHSSIPSSPDLSVSPTLDGFIRKSLRTSLNSSPLQQALGNPNVRSETLNLSFSPAMANKPSPTQFNTTSIMPTESIAASLQRGLQVLETHQHNSPGNSSSFAFSCKSFDCKPFHPAEKSDAAVQTIPEKTEIMGNSVEFVCTLCKKRSAASGEEVDGTQLPLVPVDPLHLTDGSNAKTQVPKAVEKILAGAIRREMALEEFCSKQTDEIQQLNRLIQQYKHECECNAVIQRIREDKICRLEGLMDGVIPTEEFMEQEFLSLNNEHKLLKDKYENHPELLKATVQLRRVQDELERYINFYELGEKEVLMEEIQDLRNQLQNYLDKSPKQVHKWSSRLQITHACETGDEVIPDSLNDGSEEKFEQERHRWAKMESELISLVEELRAELESSHSLSEKQRMELDAEKKCTEEIKEALQMAMQGHACILEQYADLQEKHTSLLGMHRKMREGIADIKREAAKAGIKGAESRFIDSLAAEISALKAEREKEKQFWRDQNNGLQAQLRDTAEAVQAAGELLVRFKESEEAVSFAKARAFKAQQEVEAVHQEMDKLKRHHEREIETLKQLYAARSPQLNDVSGVKLDESHNLKDQFRRDEFEPFYCEEENEFVRDSRPSWFTGYDRCNI